LSSADDGNVCRNCLHIGITVNDKLHLEKFKNDIQAEHPVVTKTYISKNKPSAIARIDIYSPKIISDLNNHGIVSAKTNILDWNKCTKNIHFRLHKYFFLGFFDGDGSWAGIKKMKFQIGCASYNFISPLQEFMIVQCKLNKTKFYSPKKQALFWTLAYGGNKQMRKIYQWLYDDKTSIELCLHRKEEKARKILFEIF